jgi:hypothetical protein
MIYSTGRPNTVADRENRGEWAPAKNFLASLPKPKEVQRGFSKDVDSRELYWIEDFIQQMCRIKNPDLYNIAKSTFLLKASIEGLTDGTPS